MAAGCAGTSGTGCAAIDTVIFDIGEVLYRWDLRFLFEKLIDDPQELDWFLAHVVTPEWHSQHDAGVPLADMVPERIAQFPQYREHIMAYAAQFVESIPGPVAGSLELVRRLAANDIPLYAISNFGAEFWPIFRPGAPIFDLFSGIIVSGEEKMAKPDPAIYNLAIRRFALAPARCLFIDDRLENIEAARAAGMSGHHFSDADLLEQELVQIGLI